MKLSKNQKLALAGLISLAGIGYIFKQNKNWKTDLEGLDVNIDGDKLSQSLGNKIRNNPELVKSLGKSFLNNEKVKTGTKNLARKALVKIMSKG